jgi:uncharacterized protein (DUF488 family)
MTCLQVGSVEEYLMLRNELISICTSHIYASILVKFGIRVLHIRRLKVCESRGYRCRNAFTFMMGVNEIKFTRVPRSCNIMKLKTTLIKSVL